MDNNFQTSFIPKKPLAEERAPVAEHSSILTLLATLIFFAALAAAAGMYFYKASLEKNITSMTAELAASRNSFEPSLIATLQQLDRRITSANQLLNNHIVVSPIFAALEVNTLKSVQFTKFSYVTTADPSSQITIKMSGMARDYASIALQSDQLATNTNIHNSIFSNLSLEEKTGMVGFDLTFTVDASLVHFVNHLDELTSQQGTPSSPSDSGVNTAAPVAPGTPTQPATPPANQPATPVNKPPSSGGTGSAPVPTWVLPVTQ